MCTHPISQLIAPQYSDQLLPIALQMQDHHIRLHSWVLTRVKQAHKNEKRITEGKYYTH